MEEEEAPTEDERIFLKPRLLSHKQHSQVLLCETYFPAADDDLQTPCIAKIFPPKSKPNYDKELAVYTHDTGSAGLSGSARPRLLDSGTWSKSRYKGVLGGKLPSVLKRSDTLVFVIVLEYLESEDLLATDQPSEVRLRAAKGALRYLRVLHTEGILHGDVSVDNVLFRKIGNTGYEPFWIDYSAAVVQASEALIGREWKKSIGYFARLVTSSRRFVLTMAAWDRLSVATDRFGKCNYSLIFAFNPDRALPPRSHLMKYSLTYMNFGLRRRSLIIYLWQREHTLSFSRLLQRPQKTIPPAV